MSSNVPQIFDNRRRALRLRRASARQSRAAAAQWLANAMAEDVIERLDFMRWEGGPALVSGLGSGAVAATLGSAIAPSPIDYERPIESGPFALIASLGELDTVNDLPGALIHLREALKPGGLLLATMLGAGSLPKLREAMLAGDGDRAAARIHPQIDNRAASALLQRARFGRQVVDHHTLTVRYRALDQLAADLRDQAQTSVLADRAPALGKVALARAQAAFAAQADADGKVSERFEILTLTAWKD